LPEVSPPVPPVVGKNVAPPVSSATLMPMKEEFVGTAEKKLADLGAKIDDLAKKAATATGDVKAQTDQAVTSLREQRDKAGAAFEELKKASADAWQALKPGV